MKPLKSETPINKRTPEGRRAKWQSRCKTRKPQVPSKLRLQTGEDQEDQETSRTRRRTSPKEGRIVRKNRSRPFKDFHSEWLETLRSTLLPLLRLSMSSSSSHLPPFSTAFDSPSQDLISKIDQIERGLRLIVPAINKRLRGLQYCFVENIAVEWAATSSKGKEDGSVTVSEEAIRSQLEELESVFGDANRLRRSILSEIVGAADVYQGALFLEALAEFVLGFRDPDLLREFEQCKIPLSPESS